MTWLLDGNVLVALTIDSHVHHDRARRWFDSMGDPFATCVVTEGTLLRLHLRFAANRTVAAAWAVLERVHAMADHEFWDDGFSYCGVPHRAVLGAGQVTDAWLAELARRRGGRLATMDEALAMRDSDVAFLLPD